jgi:hypothetical protein
MLTSAGRAKVQQEKVDFMNKAMGMFTSSESDGDKAAVKNRNTTMQAQMEL